MTGTLAQWIRHVRDSRLEQVPQVNANGKSLPWSRYVLSIL
jgi:hypothetical protein